MSGSMEASVGAGLLSVITVVGLIFLYRGRLHTQRKSQLGKRIQVGMLKMYWDPPQRSKLAPTCAETYAALNDTLLIEAWCRTEADFEQSLVALKGSHILHLDLHVLDPPEKDVPLLFGGVIPARRFIELLRKYCTDNSDQLRLVCLFGCHTHIFAEQLSDVVPTTLGHVGPLEETASKLWGPHFYAHLDGTRTLNESYESAQTCHPRCRRYAKFQLFGNKEAKLQRVSKIV
jgi:hypothetical protein